MAFSIGNKASNVAWKLTQTGTVTITLAAGSVVLIVAHQATASVNCTVTSVTSANLTFAFRSSLARTNSGSDTAHQEGEVWWAYSSGALTSEVITVTSSNVAGPTNGTIAAIECKGVINPTSPWDANGSLPDKNTVVGSGNTPATVTGFSTNSTVPVAFFFVLATTSQSGAFTGWTSINSLVDAGSSFNSIQRCWFQTFSSQQSNQTYAVTGNSTEWMVISDAFAMANFYTISPTQGTYTLTGETVTLTSGRSISPDHGVYTLTGESITANSSRSVSPVHGIYTLTGESTLTNSSRSIAIAHGIYTLTGESVGLAKLKILEAIQGIYNLVGYDAILAFVKAGGVFKPFVPGSATDYNSFSLWSNNGPGWGSRRRTRIKSWVTPK